MKIFEFVNILLSVWNRTESEFSLLLDLRDFKGRWVDCRGKRPKECRKFIKRWSSQGNISFIGLNCWIRQVDEARPKNSAPTRKLGSLYTRAKWKINLLCWTRGSKIWRLHEECRRLTCVLYTCRRSSVVQSPRPHDLHSNKIYNLPRWTHRTHWKFKFKDY